jgi:hypothetical protein
MTNKSKWLSPRIVSSLTINKTLQGGKTGLDKKNRS